LVLLQKEKRAIQFLSTITGIIILITVACFQLTKNNITHSQTIVSYTGNDTAMQDYSIDFKIHNRFAITYASKLGCTIYYGKFAQTKDTIVITSINDAALKSLFTKAIIKGDTLYWKDKGYMIHTK